VLFFFFFVFVFFFFFFFFCFFLSNCFVFFVFVLFVILLLFYYYFIFYFISFFNIIFVFLSSCFVLFIILIFILILLKPTSQTGSSQSTTRVDPNYKQALLHGVRSSKNCDTTRNAYSSVSKFGRLQRKTGRSVRYSSPKVVGISKRG
jgi:hypothetical protein